MYDLHVVDEKLLGCHFLISFSQRFSDVSFLNSLLLSA